MSLISESISTPNNPGSRTYRRDECVVFHKTREAFGGLSNMAAGFPLVISEIPVATTEALYQACRFPLLPDVQKLILVQSSPMTAKMKSKPFRDKTREDWDDVRVAIMKWCVKIKLAQHWNKFGSLLLSTGDKPIVELSRSDRFWGAIPEPEDGKILVGSNVLGRILMDVRERLRSVPSDFYTISPLPIANFLLLGNPILPINSETQAAPDSKANDETKPYNYKDLEQQVQRIHALLDGENAKVVWNDRIQDPDYPTQTRQIDISIRRDDSLTLVECRLHKDPQDVTWIEELMGRRESLKADAIIAVSRSGFTKSATAKAKQHGIFLRDFSELSEEEIRQWGLKRRIFISFCEFSDARCSVTAPIGTISKQNTITDLNGNPISPMMWRMLIQDVMHRLDKDRWSGQRVRVNTTVQAPLRVNGEVPLSIEFDAAVRRITERVALSSVATYRDAIAVGSEAEIGTFNFGKSEIIERGDQLAVTIDLSTVHVPTNSCFEYATLDAGRIVNADLSIIGERTIIDCNIPIEIRIRDVDRSTGT